jgi:hypothetical protein
MSMAFSDIWIALDKSLSDVILGQHITPLPEF